VLTVETVSFQPPSCQARSRSSLRCSRSLGMPSAGTQLYWHRDAPVLPHVVDLVQAPDLREPGTDWRSQLAAGLDALSPAHVSTKHSAVLACSAPRSPGVLPLQHRAWVQLVRAQLEDAALVVRRRRGEVTAPMLSIHFWCNANNMTHRNSWQSWDLRCVSIGSIALYALAC
jgi:hypothetical protein